MQLGCDGKVLRQLVIRMAQAVLEERVWPVALQDAASLADSQGLSLEVTSTPRSGFRLVHIWRQSAPTAWRVTLVQSNPEKVLRAEHKVMVYLEIPRGHRKRVGQVRRRLYGEDTVYELMWFPDTYVSCGKEGAALPPRA